MNLKAVLMESLGSVIGSNHLGSGGLPIVNNQDAFRVSVAEEHAIIVICDGCSSARNSEVGAKLLATVVLEAFKAHSTSDKTADEIVAAVEKTAIEKLRHIASGLTAFDTSGTQPKQHEDRVLANTVSSYFLATVIGAYCTPERCFIWGLGDGVYGYNQDGVPHIEVVRSLNNYPSYLGYNLLKEWPSDVPHQRMSVYKEFKRLPECIMVGSDGVEDLIGLAGRNFPGSDEKIPRIEELLVNKRYLESHRTIDQLLIRIQAETVQPKITTEVVEKGNYQEITSKLSVSHPKRLLRDDTTLIVIGKRPEPVVANTDISRSPTDMQELKHPSTAVTLQRGPVHQPLRKTPQKTTPL